MKVVADNGGRRADDFYTTTLAPVNRQHETRFGLLDGTMLLVLFVEVGVFMRMFLAT